MVQEIRACRAHHRRVYAGVGGYLAGNWAQVLEISDVQVPGLGLVRPVGLGQWRVILAHRGTIAIATMRVPGFAAVDT